MMPKFVGVATQIFIPAHHYYHTISECKHEYHDETFPAMPPSCEAFGVLVYENCWSKWKHVYALEHSKELGGKKVGTVAKDSGKIKKKAAEHHVFCDVQPEFDTKWTIQNSGQAALGGWKSEAVAVYWKYGKRCKKARETAVGKAQEQEILRLLRAEYNITAATFEPQRKLDGKAKTSGDDDDLPEAEFKKSVITMFESDDEEEGGDDDDSNSE